jgi:hypothetical protein
MRLIFILLTPIFLFADATYDGAIYTFQVDNPTLLNIYFNIFNAIAAFFSSDNPNTVFITLIKLVFVVGGFIVFAKGTLNALGSQSNPSEGLKEYAKYTLGAMAILSIIYSSYSSIYIKTNNFETICSNPHEAVSFFTWDSTANQNSLTQNTHDEIIVDNVPTVIAFVFSTVNKVGIETTRMANMIFSDSSLDFQSSSTNVDFIQSIISLQNTDLKELIKKYI